MKPLLFLILFLTFQLSCAHTLLIGTTAQNPPFESIADAKADFYGFDIDIMSAVCQRIKAQCKFKPIIFNDLFSQLAAGKIDLAIAAIIITDFRQQQFIFSMPYLASDGQFLTTKDSSISKPEDIVNKRVGVRLGTPFKKLALKLYKNQITIVEFTEISNLLNALNHNAIDIVLTNAAAAKYWYANDSDTYKLVGAEIPTGEGYGIMANPSNSKLMEQINQALVNIEADGTYLQIYARYFGE